MPEQNSALNFYVVHKPDRNVLVRKIRNYKVRAFIFYLE
jgi:hypothetical protein